MNHARHTRKNQSHRDASRYSIECTCDTDVCSCRPMHRTRHFEKRQSQRGVSQRMVDLAYSIGSEAGSNKIVVGRREAAERLAQLEDERRLLLKIMDKGGLTVVTDGGALITTYCGANRKH